MKSNNNNIVHSSSKYQEASIKLRMEWAEYKGKEEQVRYELVKMVKILENDEGYSRMEAIEKIIADHKDLDGFSKATIYRQLPEDMKHSQKRDLQKLKQDDDVTYKDSDFSHEKSENINNTSKALEEFRKTKGTAASSPSTVIKEYDLPEPTTATAVTVEQPQEEEQEEVIYDNAGEQIKQNQKQIVELIREIEKLREDYERVITPYEIIETNEIDGKKRTQTIHVDPYKRTAWSEQQHNDRNKKYQGH